MIRTRAEESPAVVTAAIVFRISLKSLRDLLTFRSRRQQSSNQKMSNRLLRPLLIVEFLLAVQVLSSFWAQVGGQYHLELMFWPWKLGLNLLAATLIVAITACLE